MCYRWPMLHKEIPALHMLLGERLGHLVLGNRVLMTLACQRTLTYPFAGCTNLQPHPPPSLTDSCSLQQHGHGLLRAIFVVRIRSSPAYGLTLYDGSHPSPCGVFTADSDHSSITSSAFPPPTSSRSRYRHIVCRYFHSGIHCVRQ